VGRLQQLQTPAKQQVLLDLAGRTSSHLQEACKSTSPSLRDVGAIDSDARKFFPGICWILPASSSSNKAAKISEDDNWFPGAR
jgi:hypothetical protein